MHAQMQAKRPLRLPGEIWLLIDEFTDFQSHHILRRCCKFFYTHTMPIKRVNLREYKRVIEFFSYDKSKFNGMEQLRRLQQERLVLDVTAFILKRENTSMKRNSDESVEFQHCIDYLLLNNLFYEYCRVCRYIRSLKTSRLTLAGIHVNIARMAGHAILAASTVGDACLVSHLLKLPDVDPSVSGNVAFRSACAAGHLEVVQVLAADDRVDVSDYGNHAVRVSARHDRLPVLFYLVQVLGREGRIDASDLNNEALRSACRLGLVEAVKILLQNERVVEAFSRDPFGLVVLVAERGLEGKEIVGCLVESLRDCKKKKSVKSIVKRLFPAIADGLSWSMDELNVDIDVGNEEMEFDGGDKREHCLNDGKATGYGSLMSMILRVTAQIASHPVGYTVFSTLALVIAAILHSK